MDHFNIQFRSCPWDLIWNNPGFREKKWQFRQDTRWLIISFLEKQNSAWGDTRIGFKEQNGGLSIKQAIFIINPLGDRDQGPGPGTRSPRAKGPGHGTQGHRDRGARGTGPGATGNGAPARDQEHRSHGNRAGTRAQGTGQGQRDTGTRGPREHRGPRENRGAREQEPRGHGEPLGREFRGPGDQEDQGDTEDQGTRR